MNQKKTIIKDTNKNNKNNKNDKIIKNKKKIKNTKNKKFQDGGNVPAASVNLVKNMVDLGKQIFKTAGGIMRMPADLARASPPPPKETVPNRTPPEKMPKF